MSPGERRDGDEAGTTGPTPADRALDRLLEQWQHEDPEGYAAFLRGDTARAPQVDTPTAYRQGSSMRVRSPRVAALLVVVALAIAVLLSPLPGWALDAVSGEATLPATAAAGQPGSAAPEAQPGVRLAPAVPVGGAPPAGRYAFLQTRPGGSDPVTFDPCRPVHYVVREHPDVGERGVQVVHEAVAAVSAATGLVFVFDGLTDEPPVAGRSARSGRLDAPVLVAWSDPGEVPELAGSVAGVGGPVSIRTPDGSRRYVSGHVYLDAPDIAPDLGFLRRDSARAVVMHELGHVVGADHPADPTQLMAAEHTGQTEWGEGDRYALAVLGQGPCATGY